MVSIEDHKILYRSSLSSLSNITDNNGPSLCQICFEPFKQNIRIPKLLPCGHSFCNDCITALKFNSICICKCPICRHSFPLRYDTKFPTNYSLLGLYFLCFCL
uniref:RING-type domain-containing protein n=1 Tax=Wuchereria bancrofti TaxID=6293 RepID=A0A1I8EEI9_WUCBA